MLRKYREYILAAGLAVIVITFIKFVNPERPVLLPPGHSMWEIREIQRDLMIWLGIVAVSVTFMVIFGYLTRPKK